MKTIQSTLIVLALGGCILQHCQAEAPTGPAPNPPEPVTPPAPAPAPKPSALVRYKPRAGRDPGGVERSVTAATRAGEADLRLVALSPGKGAVTVLAKPVLWWHQSGPTKHGELQLTLTKMAGARPQTLFSGRLTARPAGYQCADLADLTLNPRGLALEPGATYQWSLSVVGGTQKSGIYATLVRVADPALEKALRETPDEPATRAALAEAGNWHELFGRAAALARQHPADTSHAAARDSLLEQIGLLKELKNHQP